ncbi:MAG: 3'-5' exoribonuclease YhaM family protein [Lachnospirales bacterium]
MRYINELREDEHIIEFYFCKQKQTLKTKTGKSYYSLKLQDKTGVVDAKVWDINREIQTFEENDYIKIQGDVVSHQNNLQIKIGRLRRASEGEYDPTDFIPTTDKDVDILYNNILSYISSFENQYLKELLNNIFTKNETIASSIKQHSAAKSMHHNYMGGLLEHTINVVDICDFLSKKYSSVNRDLLLSVAMLHDIGKIFELSPFPYNDYTDDGQLLGHIIIGTELITEESSKIKNFPHELQSLLKHCIIAHHGKYEYGSPKLPQILEALLLHLADNIDAKSKIFEDAIMADQTQGNWVGFNRMLETNIRKTVF